MKIEEDIELAIGKIYFFDYGGTCCIGRLKEINVCNYNFYDHLHYWSGYENYRRGGYCVKAGIINIREASDSEKHNLLRHSIENKTI